MGQPQKTGKHNGLSPGKLFGNQFTPNIPLPFANAEHFFNSQKAFILDAKLSYTHRHFYRINDGRKQMLHTKYPTISLGWKQGFDGIAGSTSKFQLLEAGLRHGFSVKLVGRFNYEIEAGAFINNEKCISLISSISTAIPCGLKATATGPICSERFPLRKSTNEHYLRGHLRHEHTRIFLKRLPF